MWIVEPGPAGGPPRRGTLIPLGALPAKESPPRGPLPSLYPPVASRGANGYRCVARYVEDDVSFALGVVDRFKPTGAEGGFDQVGNILSGFEVQVRGHRARRPRRKDGGVPARRRIRCRDVDHRR